MLKLTVLKVKYKIQFETCNYDYFKMVERACQEIIDKDKKDKATLKHCSQSKVLGYL